MEAAYKERPKVHKTNENLERYSKAGMKILKVDEMIEMNQRGWRKIIVSQIPV
jgi:hypothetical protein